MNNVPATQTNMAPVAIPRIERSIAAGPARPCTSSSGAMDLSGPGTAARAAPTFELVSVVVLGCGEGRSVAMGGGLVDGRGGVLSGSISILVTPEAIRARSVPRMGMETRVKPAAAQNQAAAGDARQQIKADRRTKCRSEALPASRRDMSQPALDASATTTVTTSTRSRLLSPG
jgi:hypothetical protein